MNNENTKLQDIAEISSNLDGKINASQIKFSQLISCELGKSMNDLFFVKKMYGLYFYTSSTALDHMMNLKGNKPPVYVICKNSKNVFEIK